MANEHYDEFCRASYPDLNQSERQLLGHYCARFNEQVNPPRAWPGLQELLNITGFHEKSVSRVLRQLIAKGYLRRVTRASKERGLKAEFAPNMRLIRSRIKVTEELPNLPDVSHLQVTEEHSISYLPVQLGNAQVANKPPESYPKPKEPNKPNNVDRFNLVILYSLPERLRTINPGSNFEKLLDECDALGISDEIRKLLSTNRWDNVTANAGGIVSKIIKDAIERKRSGQLVVESIKVTPSPPPFKYEERVLTPRSASTEALIEDFLKGVGRLPK